MEDVKSGTESDQFFRGPFELYLEDNDVSLYNFCSKFARMLS